MRKFFFILAAVFVAFSGFSSAQWKQITKIPAQFRDNYWLEVYFLPDKPNYGWCCGYNGMVIRTTDGGNSWQGVKIRNAGQIESIHFVNENVGYVVSVTSLTGFGASVVYKSVDGGATWRDITPEENVSLWGCWFLNENYGVVLGGECWGYNLFYLTEDGGATWKLRYYNESNSKNADPILYPDGSGYAVSSGRIWQTLDSGRTWKVYREIKGKDWHEELAVSGKSFFVPYDVECAGSNINGGARYSHDGGITWQDFAIGSPCYGSFLTSDSTGWFCGKNRAIYYISNWGKMIEDKHCGIPAGTNLDDLYFFSDSSGFVVGEGIFKYTPIDELHPHISADKLHICEGESTVITADSTFDFYTWSTGETTRSITVSRPGDYSLTVNSNECDSSHSNTIHIDYFPKPKAEFDKGKNFLGCQGDTIEINLISGAESILWYDNSTSLNKEFTQSGSYRFTLTDTNGCTADDSVIVNLLPYPTAEIAPKSTDTTLCDGTQLDLNSPSALVAGQKVDWFDAETGKLLAANSGSISISKSSKVFVIATNEAGCADTSDIYTYNIAYSTDHFSFGSSDIVFIDTVIAGNTSCSRITIHNITDASEKFSSITLLHNLEFSIPQNQLPLTIPPRDSANLIICFTPHNLYACADTMMLSDVCSTHMIILRGWCKPYVRDGSGKCGTDVILTTKKLSSGATFVSSQPYPNPSAGKIAIDYTYKSKNPNAAFAPEITLTNSVGENIPFAVSFDKNQNTDSENIITENGTISIDASLSASDTYFITLRIGKEIVGTYKIISK